MRGRMYFNSFGVVGISFVVHSRRFTHSTTLNSIHASYSQLQTLHTQTYFRTQDSLIHEDHVLTKTHSLAHARKGGPEQNKGWCVPRCASCCGLCVCASDFLNGVRLFASFPASSGDVNNIYLLRDLASLEGEQRVGGALTKGKGVRA